jgi:uncharacterized protein YndB with AHSA1/START domain
MTTVTETAVTTQVFRVYIKTTPQAIWDAITKPEWTNRYGYTGFANYDLRPGGRYEVRGNEEFLAQARERGGDVPDVVVAGEVIEVDPPHRLVTTFRMLMDPEMAKEVSRLTHVIKDLGGYCSLTIIHDLEGAPTLASLVSGSLEEFGAGGGHAWVLSDLKSLLETGKTLAG